MATSQTYWMYVSSLKQSSFVSQAVFTGDSAQPRATRKTRKINDLNSLSMICPFGRWCLSSTHYPAHCRWASICKTCVWGVSSRDLFTDLLAVFTGECQSLSKSLIKTDYYISEGRRFLALTKNRLHLYSRSKFIGERSEGLFKAHWLADDHLRHLAPPIEMGAD